MPTSTQPEAALITAVSLYLRNTPITRGRWRLLKKFLPVIREVGPGLGDRTVKTRYGFSMQVDMGDWLGQYIYLTGGYEPPTAHVIGSILKAGETFIDVGANAGFFSLLASVKVGKNGQVIAYEPVPRVLSRLRKNIEINDFQNIQSFDLALSNKCQMATLYEGPADHSGLSSMRQLDEASRRLQISCVPLDEHYQSNRKVDLIKIDVEGAEQLAVEGMKQLLQRDEPHLVMEVTDTFLRNFEHSSKTLTDMLRKMGYQMFLIKEEGLMSRAEVENWPHQFNALFTKDPQVAKSISMKGIK